MPHTRGLPVSVVDDLLFHLHVGEHYPCATHSSNENKAGGLGCITGFGTLMAELRDTPLVDSQSSPFGAVRGRLTEIADLLARILAELDRSSQTDAEAEQ